MSDESRVLLDLATLAAADDMPTTARKLRDVAKYIEDLELANLAQEREILALKDGSCRFNCTLKSVMWKAGFTWGFVRAHKSRAAVGDMDKEYDKWRERNG